MVVIALLLGVIAVLLLAIFLVILTTAPGLKQANVSYMFDWRTTPTEMMPPTYTDPEGDDAA